MRLLWIVLLLALTVAAQDQILLKIFKYRCVDLQYTSTVATKVKLTDSTVYLPDRGVSFTYEPSGLVFKSQDNTRVSEYTAKMYCSRENFALDTGRQFGWNGTYSGTVYKNSTALTIQTKTLTPIIIGRIDAQNRVTGRLGMMLNYNIDVGAALTQWAFDVTLTNEFDCSISVLDAGTGLTATYGCVGLSDFSPNLVSDLGVPICQSFPEDPVVEYNCGPPQVITRAEENQRTISEAFSVARSTTTSMNVGKSFQVTRGVGKTSATNTRSGSKTTTETSSKTTNQGYTEENSEQTSRLSTSVATSSRQKKYTLGNGRQVKELKARQDCVATGTAKGCLDTNCSISILLNFQSVKSTITTRHEMSSLPCTQ